MDWLKVYERVHRSVTPISLLQWVETVVRCGLCRSDGWGHSAFVCLLGRISLFFCVPHGHILVLASLCNRNGRSRPKQHLWIDGGMAHQLVRMLDLFFPVHLCGRSRRGTRRRHVSYRFQSRRWWHDTTCSSCGVWRWTQGCGCHSGAFRDAAIILRVVAPGKTPTYHGFVTVAIEASGPLDAFGGRGGGGNVFTRECRVCLMSQGRHLKWWGW